jgi:ABC-type multidrug transport system ATPase subunit
LVQGLATGEADRDQDGLIGLDELYEYVYDEVRAATPNQTPGKWTFGMEGGLYIARRSRPVTTPAALPPELQEAMESTLAGIRGGAVQELAGILRGRHAGLALAARLALERLTEDDSRAVAAAATATLGVHPPEPPQPPQPRRPELALSATAIDLGHLPQHGQSPEHRVRIGNSGGGDLNARASTSASWLKLRQIGDELVIAAASSTAGQYEGTVTVDSDGGTATIRVHARVDPFPLPATEAEVASQPEPVPEKPATTWPRPQQDPALTMASSAPAGAPPPVTETAHSLANPAASTDVGMLPSVDRRPTQRLRLPTRTMRIGRASDNDLVLADDLEASPSHAELRRSPTGDYEIVDLSSNNGTFVNGKRVSRAMLSEHDIVSVGRSTFRLAEGELRQFVDEGEVSLTAQDLVVRDSDGKVLLDHVSFPIPEKCMLGVIGSSGSGKSTLLDALTGMRPADTGTVVYDNRDLYQHYAELRHRIGIVPQENALNTQLPVRRALQYSAGLRFPADTKRSERDARVDEVISELGLTKHANTRADRLSGGQLKRANVAQGLLTNPSLLILDEPTSGLDPGLDKSVMEQMRDLAHDGRTVIVFTTNIANLDKCDRLLVLVPGGRVAFYGPPDEGLAYFGLPGWAEVFQAFEAYPDRDWAAEFAASPAYAQYMTGPRWRPAYRPGEQRQPPPDPPRRVGAPRQMTTLTRRNLRLMATDRGYLIFTGLLPVVLGVLIYFVGSAQGLVGPPHSNQNAEELLLTLVICACLAGAASSVRELVKERSIYVRERAAGLSSGAYLASKLLILSVLSIAQSCILVLIGLAGRPLPPTGAFLTGSPLAELLLGIAALTLASMCLGLLMSALVSAAEKAIPSLVLLTIAQIILSGGIVPLSGKAGLQQLAWIAPSRWGFGAVASTVNLNVIGVSTPGSTDPLWAHSSGNWLRDMGFTIGLAVIFTLLAWTRLPRLSPGRRR